MAIDSENLDYQDMKARWKLPLALDGGTFDMRKAGVLWLPQEPKESDEAYTLRLNRTVLFNVYRRAITNLVGSAFNSAITVTGVPKELKYLEFNINGENQSITELGAQLFTDSLIFGKSHVYVDFPEVNTEGLNYEQYKEMGLSPYIARVSPLNVIGWRHDYNNGAEDLQYARIRDVRLEENDDFEQFEHTIIRLVRPDSIEVHEFNPNVDEVNFEKIESYPNTLGEVPLLCSYANKVAPFKAYPPLEDLAWLNLRHYQSSSDQSNILHIARVPFLLATGFSEEDMETAEIAANRMVMSTNENANIKYVEHTGQAIAAGRMDIKDIEEQMAKAGADILFSKSVARQTAAGRKIDQAEALSTIQISLRSIEQMLEHAYKLAAKWLDLEEEFEPSVSIGSDLDLAEDPNPVQSFIQLQELLGLKPEVMLEELKRRGILAPHIKIEDIQDMSANLARINQAVPEPSEESDEDEEQNLNEPESPNTVDED